jgi:LPXTG-motif cell wall-anchored protein
MRKTLTSITLVAAGVLGLASVAGSAGAVTLDATGTAFRFGYDGQTVTDAADLDVPLPEGSSIRFDAVATIDGTVIDAVVTFVDGTNLSWDTAGEIGRIDDTFPDDEEDPFIELQLGSTEDGEAIAEIRVDFFEGGTNTPVTISNLPLNIYDIDSLQWAEADGVAGYSMSTNTHLTVTNPSSGTYRFTSPDEETDGDDGSAYTIGRTKMIFTAASSVTVRVSVPAETGGSFDLDFSNGLPWTDQFGGGENTTNLPETGMAVGILAGLSVAMIAAGAALGARRRIRA